MNQVITLEVRFFLVSILSGILLLIVYDILRILRIILKQGAIQIGIQDFLFWVVSGIVIFRMMYQMNDGVIRGFSVIGIFLGMLIYKYSISDWMVHTLSKGILTFNGWVVKAVKILVSPIVWIIKQCIRFVKFLGRILAKAANWMAKLFQKIVLARFLGLKNKVKSYKMKREALKEQRRAIRAEKSNAAGKNDKHDVLSEDATAYTEAVASREPMAVAVHQARVTSKVVHRQ